MNIWNDIKLPRLETRETIQLRKILVEVAKKNDIPVFMLKGTRKFQELVKARSQFVIRSKKEVPNATLTQIGSIINRDHSTIINLMKWKQ